jgi:recombination protein RecT
MSTPTDQKAGRSVSLRDEVAGREQTTRQGAIEKAVRLAEDRVSTHRGWFEKVIPSHVPADQFIALALGAIRRGSDELKMALWQHPETFFDALAECARLGLVPGTDQFYMIPFKDGRDKIGNRPNPDKGTYSVSHIVGYKGELDMIYRTGAVAAVHCHVVRREDKFDYQPGEGLPFHEIPANEWQQRGLGGGAEQRGFLTGVWAFAAMVSGGHSQPVVLGKDEVLSYRSRSAAVRRAPNSMAFWGPEWPKEGPDTHMMWRKTGLRRLYGNVPHSTEYHYKMAQALATAQADPIPVGSGRVVGAGDDDEPLTGTVLTAAPGPADGQGDGKP